MKIWFVALTIGAIGLNSVLSADEPVEPVPTYAEAPYGTHERNVLDFWQAKGDGPRPLLVNIHGGGWTGGDKKLAATKITPFLEKGISVASINYRLTPQFPLPAPVFDAARAIQFLRTKAKDWNINPSRIAVTAEVPGPVHRCGCFSTMI